ncbi:MAG: site-specific DNA-methyltransferase [Flavobacterium sp.]|nr:site-specific DNA-methyltransferase [Flavobacterium sp.]
MQDVLQQLTTVLPQEKQFLARDGQLLKSSVVAAAQQLQPQLLWLLLLQPTIRQYFFQQVGDVWVFDKIKFEQCIASDTFLSDKKNNTLEANTVDALANSIPQIAF